MMSDQKKEWLIREGNSQTWWGPNRGGYCSTLIGAGLYTEAEAKKIQDFSDRYGRRDTMVHVSEMAGQIRELTAAAERLTAALCTPIPVTDAVVDRNDAGFEGDTPRSWPMDTDTEDPPHQQFQGDPVRVRLRDHKGGTMGEWPISLRIRQFPAAGPERA